MSATSIFFFHYLIDFDVNRWMKCKYNILYIIFNRNKQNKQEKHKLRYTKSKYVNIVNSYIYKNIHINHIKNDQIELLCSCAKKNIE